MHLHRSRISARLGVAAVLAIGSLAACGGGGGFDADKFADRAAEDGAMTKEQATCFADYIDKNGSDKAKDEFQKMADSDDANPPAPDDEALAKEMSDLTVNALGECVTIPTLP